MVDSGLSAAGSTVTDTVGTFHVELPERLNVQLFKFPGPIPLLVSTFSELTSLPAFSY